MHKDKLHYNSRRIDSYNKPFNFVISERAAGKTANLIATKVYKQWRHHNRPSIILRRQIADITTTYIDDLQDAINDFIPKSQKIKFEYKKGSIKEGVVDVTVKGRPFCRFIALSNPKGRIKSLKYDACQMLFDEFIVDVRGGEKYLTDEANKFKEIYNTFNRFCVRKYHRPIKCYFAGNPYSVYTPLFTWLNIDLALVHPGAFIVGPNYVIECYQTKPELKAWIKANNPLYDDSIEDEYKNYAFNGVAVNDMNIKVEGIQPDGYRLKYVFRICHKYLGVYHRVTNRKDKIGYDCGKFWIAVIDYVGENRKILAVDFDNLISNSQLVTTDMRALMWRLKDAIASRDVTFGSIDAGYLTESLYGLL